MAGKSDMVPSANATIITTDDTEARARIAAKLKLATKIPVAKLLNGSNSSSASSVRSSSFSKSESAPRGSERKLLHKSAEQWSAYEKTPTHMKVVPSARILPIRCPLSSLYVCEYISCFMCVRVRCPYRMSGALVAVG